MSCRSSYGPARAQRRYPPAGEFVIREAPAAILIAASLRQFGPAAPVILLAHLSRQAEAAPLVAEGTIEFVAREGDFFALAAGPIAEWPQNIGEIFRHEINNPLTGILGNSEMLLAHREHLTAVDAQRLETVVALAVRLRETIRRLSATLEFPAQPLISV